MRRLDNWQSNMIWAAFSGLIAAAVVTVSLKETDLAALALTGLVGASLAIAWPPLGIVGVLSIDGFALVLPFLGIDSSLAKYGSFVLLLISAASAAIRATGAIRYIASTAVALILFLLLYGILASGGRLGNEQILAGVRIVSTPVLCGVIGISMGTKDVIRLLRFGTVLVAASFVASLLQRFLGVESLLSLGLEAGTTVRTFDGTLRAPGLFVTNYVMGAFAGVWGALALLWWPTLESNRRATLWRGIAVIASAGCLYMSIYRTGIVVLGVAIAAWVVFGRGRGSGYRKTLIVGAAGTAVYFFLKSGFGSNSSLLERLIVWDHVLASSPPNLLGYGLGYSGAASSSRFADSQITVDNYFLSLILQFGAAAVVFVLPLATIAMWMTVRSATAPVLRGGMVLLACLVAFWFVDFWEYLSAMACALWAVGVGYHFYSDAEETLVSQSVIDSRGLTYAGAH